MLATGITAPGYDNAQTHADFSNLQCHADPSGDTGAAAGDELQSLVDVGAGRPPFVPGARP